MSRVAEAADRSLSHPEPRARPREYSQGFAARYESALYALWLVVLMWAPLPLASVDAWALALLQILVFGLLAAWIIGWAAGWVQVADSVHAARYFLALLGVWVIYAALYVIPLPMGLIEWLSPTTAALHRETLAFDAGPRTLAIDPHAAQVALLKTLAYVGGFLLTLLLVNSRQRAQRFVFTLVVFAFVLALYGIMMHLVGANIRWFGSDLNHGAVAVGTHFNRNHFAGYLEMTLALGIGLLIADLRDKKAETWRQFLKHFLEWIFSPKFRLRLMLCVLVIALVSTRSRMGNTAFFASLFLTGVIGIALSRHATRGTVVLLTSLIAIDLFIVGSWFGVEKLAQRLDQTQITRPQITVPGAPAAPTAPAVAPSALGLEESVEQRQDAAADTLAMIKDHFWVGVGPGGWAGRYLNYRGPHAYEGIFEHAHNDFAEFTADFGVVGLVLLALMVLWTLGVALRAQAVRRDPLMRGLSFAALMGILSIMIHSSVDFNLQIPANALYFMVLLALAWISLHLDRRGGSRRSGRSSSRSRP